MMPAGDCSVVFFNLYTELYKQNNEEILSTYLFYCICEDELINVRYVSFNVDTFVSFLFANLQHCHSVLENLCGENLAKKKHKTGRSF